MGYTATTTNLAHIAALVVEERPEWDHGLVFVILRSHTSMVDGSDLAVAALRCAQNRKWATPKAIGWRGPHWDGLDSKPIEVRSGPRCDVCGKYEAACWGQRPGPDDHPFTPRAGDR